MMPVTVERKWKGKMGSLSWWVDDVMFDEQTRQETRQWPADMPRWSAQMARMLLFAELYRTPTAIRATSYTQATGPSRCSISRVPSGRATSYNDRMT